MGQGDGILIKSPEGHYALIDGGPSKKVVYELSNDVPFFDKTIEMSFISHPHADHITGLIEALRNYNIDRVFTNKIDYGTPEVNTLKGEIDSQNIKSYPFIQGDKIRLGSIEIKSLWPPKDFDCSNINECSMVLLISYNDFCAYLTGDATSDMQSRLVQGNLKQCPVLKIAHQGAKDGLNQQFLGKVSPKVGVISVGENNFGHPSEETLKILEEKNIRILRTDELGTIEIISNGEQWKVLKSL